MPHNGSRPPKKGEYKNMENTIINQNWKSLIKPNKLNIKSNEDKSITTVVAEPLEKGYALTIGNSLKKNFTFFNTRISNYSYTNRWSFT